jgi:hypothetical protein
VAKYDKTETNKQDVTCNKAGDNVLIQKYFFKYFISFTGVCKSMFTVMSTRNTEFILVLLFIYLLVIVLFICIVCIIIISYPYLRFIYFSYCNNHNLHDFFHKNCKPTFAHPCILFHIVHPAVFFLYY